MGGKGLSMRKVREILRLRWGLGLAVHKVAQSCKVSPSTVVNYERRAAVEHVGEAWGHDRICERRGVGGPMEKLKDLASFLAGLPPGDVTDIKPLEAILARCWHCFTGGEIGRMAGSKLVGRMEQVSWQPPILSFVIERHGAAALGSARAELQYWAVDLEEQIATLTRTRLRQIRPPQAPIRRAEMESLAEQIASLIEDRAADDRVKWNADGTVHVIVFKLFPRGLGARATVEGRWRRFANILETVLATRGWQALGRNRFGRFQS